MSEDATMVGVFWLTTALLHFYSSRELLVLVHANDSNVEQRASCFLSAGYAAASCLVCFAILCWLLVVAMQCKGIILLLFAPLSQQILQLEVCRWQQIALIYDSKGSTG